MSRMSKPIQCPECQEGIALPFRVVTDGGEKLKVDVRCEKCRHEWCVEMAAEPLFPTPHAQPSERP